MRRSLAGLTFGVLIAGSAPAQQVISAHSGVIQMVEGTAFLNDSKVEPKFGQFPEIKQDQTFRTEEGRAEVLLTPGVFMRLGENSSIKMLSNRLADTRVEVLKGTAIVECDDLPKDNAIVLVHGDNNMMLVKHGLYRVDTDPEARLRVYDGEAIVKSEAGQLTLKSGKQTQLGGALMAENFDKNDSDALYRWSERRASYLSRANVSSAMAMRDSGGYNGTGFGGWQFNPMFGMYTYVPYNGIGYSPFGYGWFSPPVVIYYAPAYYGGGYAGGHAPISASAPTLSSATNFPSVSRAPSANQISAAGGGGFPAASGAGAARSGGAPSGGFSAPSGGMTGRAPAAGGRR